jgi:hypothetical protein
VIHVDFAICFSASAKKPIDYDKILRLIFWLRDSGFHLEKITYDSYQSQHSLNTLQKAGLKAELRSVDRMKDMDRGRKIQPEYFSYRSMLNEDRVWNPVSPLLRREILQLMSVEERPDHEKNESKDMIDAVVGACANLVESENLTPPLSEEELFPMVGSLRASREKPKPPLTEQQLVEQTYTAGDNVFFDP